jgi:hypothetical protein
MNISASDLTYENFYIFLCRVIIKHYILGTNNNCYNLNTFKLFGFPICWYLMKIITETYLMFVLKLNLDGTRDDDGYVAKSTDSSG